MAARGRPRSGSCTGRSPPRRGRRASRESATVSSAWARRTRPRARALAVAALLPLLTGSASAETFTGRVVGVTDGDTLTVLRAGRREIIRLNGIDAPEKGQPFGDRAKQFTAELVFGQVVQVVVRDHDRYGRTVADVVLADGRSLSHEVVRGGYAWWFRRYSTDVRLAALEAEARAARAGLWADRRPVAPWEWRRMTPKAGRSRMRDRMRPAVGRD